MGDLTAFQVERGWRVAVACPLEGDLPRWVTAAGARHLAWRASRAPGPSVVGETLRLRKLVRAFAPDLVHLHSAKAGLAGRLAISGRIPTVFQPHAWSFHASGGAVGRGALLWERRASRRADVIVCVSDRERAQGEAAGVRATWRVVPNGVDLDRFRPRDRAEARRALGLDPGPLAVCIGRLSRQKGQDILVDAWRTVAAALPDARLALVGGGPDETMLRARAGPGILFPGPTSEVETWLAAADVIALPSRWEGMSLSMLEAMAAGRSIVISDVAGAREAVDNASGAVVPPEDRPALAEALRERLTDPELREREGRSARRRAESRFSLENSLAAMVRVYDEVLEGRGPGQP